MVRGGFRIVPRRYCVVEQKGEKVTEQMPTVGRIVHYWLPADSAGSRLNCVAAVITRVWNSECVNLKVIPDSNGPGAWLTSIVRSGTPMRGCWSWPERV